NCVVNHVSDVSGCTDDGNQCTDDVCSSGVCTHPAKGAGAACGSSGSSVCDNPDTCDGSGNCVVNHVSDGSGCTDDGNQCTNDVRSDGRRTHHARGAGASCGGSGRR